MNDELASKLRADLEKSGMHTELQARRIFLENGWSVSGGAAYLDLDEGKSREVDVIASHGDFLKLDNDYCVYNSFKIVAEIKKTERPWVVFKRVPPKWDSSCAWNNLISAINLPAAPPKLTKNLATNSLLQKNGWEGTGIHESFKNPDTPSRWYGAFVSVLKAATDQLEMNSSEGEKISSHPSGIFKEPTEFTFIQPLVILDGILVTAELSKDNEMILTEVESAAFRFEYRTKNYTARHYRIDLVTIAGLKHYLELQVFRQTEISDGITKASGLQLTRA